MNAAHVAGVMRGMPKGLQNQVFKQVVGNRSVCTSATPVGKRGQHVSRPVATFFKTDTAPSDAVLEHMGPDAEAVVGWEIRLLYDGDCSLCMREVEMLRNRDGEEKIQFVNIAAPEYSPEDNSGVTYGEAMGNIHGILPDGSVVTSIEVFRRCYEAVGLGWVYAATKYEPVRKAAEAAYGVWSKYRLPLTGRGDLEMVLEKQRDQIGEIGCGDDGDVCELPWAKDDVVSN